MFISRLDEARSPAAAKEGIDACRTEEHDGQEAQYMDRYLRYDGYTSTEVFASQGFMNRDGIRHEPELSELSQPKDNAVPYGSCSDILEKLAEYLFDLFDANAMEDYAKMEKFEIRALESFQEYDQEEYTHQQHALHEEFVALFEQLIEGFLASEGYNIDAFYEELLHFRQKTPASVRILGSSALPLSPAEEVVEVVANYMTFEVWADLMKQQARQQAEFRTMGDHVQAAYRGDHRDNFEDSKRDCK